MKLFKKAPIIGEIGLAAVLGYALGYVYTCPHYAYIFASQIISSSLKDLILGAHHIVQEHTLSFLLIFLTIRIIKGFVETFNLYRYVSKNYDERLYENNINDKLSYLEPFINNYQFLNSYNTIRLSE